MNSRQNIRRSRASRTIWAQYVLALLAWAAAVLVLLYVGRSVLSQWTWYGTEPLYPLLHWIWRNVILVYGLAVVTGWLVISYRFISRPLRYLDELVAAAEQLARPGEDPIVLPAAMQDAEVQLNLFREQARRDAYAAREAEQRKNDLIVYLAHDLKTPLTSVIGYLTLLRDEAELSPALRARYTGIALDKAERLEELINEFFDITRFNLTRLELERQPVDLVRMLQQVASEFGPQFAEKNLTCRLDLPPALEYDCDPDKLARVFDNLLRNAFYYSFPDSQVDIRARRGEEGVELVFSNRGRTIPPEKLERIFQQFFRLDAARSTRTGGAGVGLAIVKEIVELHGGTVRAASAENRITFTVTLPPEAPKPEN